jgi:hypothetical protein
MRSLIRALVAATVLVGARVGWAGDAPYVGTWKLKQDPSVTSDAPATLTITAKDGITVTFVEDKRTCTAKFDGKDHPATSPKEPGEWTCVVAKKGPTALEVSWKKDGKIMAISTFKPSADRKTLAYVIGSYTSVETTTVIYDRK